MNWLPKSRKARASGQGRITTTNDPREAVAGRHVISTDVFASMGQEAEAETRRRAAMLEGEQRHHARSD